MTVQKGGKSFSLEALATHSTPQDSTQTVVFQLLFWHVNESILGFIHVATLLLCPLTQNTLESALKENAALMEAQKQMVSKLRAKVASLENTLEIKAKELEQANENERTAAVSIPAGQAELENLQKVLATRERELGHVKRLARTIVEQRTELEQFFYEALDQVKQEIRASRLRCKKEALQAYRCSLREATAGRIKFPPIQTFNESTHSTHSAHSDTEVAARW